MTALVMVDTGHSVSIASDTAISEGGKTTGHGTKLMLLPHVNAVLTGAGNVAMGVYVEAAVKHATSDTSADLRRQLPGLMRDAVERFKQAHGHVLEAGHQGAAAFVLATRDGLFFYNDLDDFREMKLLPGIVVDPALDGASYVPGPFGGDKHIVRLMQRQQAEGPEWRVIGGDVMRVKLQRDGMDVRRIGNLAKGQ
jgi:hypothetical protein